MTPPDNHHLTIRCPSCSQKFTVGAELKGRMVECGACENRFNVNDEVIQKSPLKFYPGERDHRALDKFARVDGPKIGMDAATPIPRGPHEKGYFSPISRVGPLRLAMGWLGSLLILGTFLVLQVTSLLEGLPVASQALIALLACAVGLGLIVWANPRNRIHSLLIGGVAAAILLSVPFIFRSKRAVEPAAERHLTIDDGPAGKEPVEGPKEETSADLKVKLSLGPLETEIRRLAESGSPLHAYGVWLRDMNESNRLSVRDYLLRSSGASPSSAIYSRGNREYLMVMTGMDRTIDQIGGIVSKIGHQPKIHYDLQLIEIKVDATIFMEGPIDKLTDKESPAFYDLNKRELESIQLDRVKRAVSRLISAEPKIYREDITRQLVVLAALPQVDFLDEVCQALLVWAENPPVANTPLLRRLNELNAGKKKIPRSLVSMLSRGKEAGAIPAVIEQWTADPTSWESLLEEFGAPIEKPILDLYPKLEATLKHSATRLLGSVGGKSSIPALEAAKPGADPELSVMLDAAIKSIRARTGS